MPCGSISFCASKHIIAYTISKGSMINVAAFVCRHDLEGTAYGGPWVTEADGAEVMAVFEGWETDVRLLIGVSIIIVPRVLQIELRVHQCIDKATKWAVHTVRPLPSFVSGNVALIGDAVSAQLPYTLTHNLDW
jgi:salicylate hydroxylase